VFAVKRRLVPDPPSMAICAGRVYCQGLLLAEVGTGSHDDLLFHEGNFSRIPRFDLGRSSSRVDMYKWFCGVTGFFFDRLKASSIIPFHQNHREHSHPRMPRYQLLILELK
jgi:hypothetical protein